MNSLPFAYLCLCLASLFWAGSFSAMKLALETFDPMVIVFGRMLLATLVLLPFAGRIRSACTPRPGDLKYLLLMSLGEPCMYFVFEANAMQYTTSGQAGMITGTLPLMVSVVAFVILKEHISRNTLIGFVLAILGVVGLSLGGEATTSAPNPLLGNFLEVLAMGAATAYIVTAKHLSSRYSPLYLTLFMTSMGTVFFFPLLFLPGTTLPSSLPLAPTACVAFLGLFASLGAFFCYNTGVKAINASQAAAFINLIPVLAVVMGWLFLDEMLTPLQLAASALVLAGIYLSQYKGKKKI